MRLNEFLDAVTSQAAYTPLTLDDKSRRCKELPTLRESGFLVMAGCASNYGAPPKYPPLPLSSHQN